MWVSVWVNQRRRMRKSAQACVRQKEGAAEGTSLSRSV